MLAAAQQREAKLIRRKLYDLVDHDRWTQLNRYSNRKPVARKHLANFYERDSTRLTLLMLAALNGHDNTVKILLSHSTMGKEYIELTGRVETIDHRVVSATALWCALDRGHQTVAPTLIERGNADVNHAPRHPLLIDAVLNGRLEVVRFLVENNYADINETVSDGKNQCRGLIIAAAKDHSEVVAYLLSKGAHTEYKTQVYENTALSAAAMFGRLVPLCLLCAAHASVHVRNASDKILFLLVGENGCKDAVDLLVGYTYDEKAFEDLELRAVSHIISDNDDQRNNFERMKHLLRQSFEKRQFFNVPKTVASSIAAYNFQQECQSIEEFTQIQNDANRLVIEAFLIRERILRPQHSAALFKPLLDRADALALVGSFDDCLHLMIHIFYLYQEMDLRTCLHRFIWVYCRMITTKAPVPDDLFLQTCRLVFET